MTPNPVTIANEGSIVQGKKQIVIPSHVNGRSAFHKTVLLILRPEKVCGTLHFGQSNGHGKPITKLQVKSAVQCIFTYNFPNARLQLKHPLIICFLSLGPSLHS